MPDPVHEDPAHVLAVAERLLGDALATLRMLTPEGWDIAYYQALTGNWHSTDVARLRDARLLSMRAGGRRFGLSPDTPEDDRRTRARLEAHVANEAAAKRPGLGFAPPPYPKGIHG